MSELLKVTDLVKHFPVARCRACAWSGVTCVPSTG